MPTIQSRQTKRQNHLQKKKGRSKSTKKKSGGRRNAHIRQSTREEGNPGRRHRKQSSKPCARARSRCEPDFVPPGRRASGKGISTHTGRRRRRRRWSWEVLRRTLSSTLNSSGDCAATTTTNPHRHQANQTHCASDARPRLTPHICTATPLQTSLHPLALAQPDCSEPQSQILPSRQRRPALPRAWGLAGVAQEKDAHPCRSTAAMHRCDAAEG